MYRLIITAALSILPVAVIWGQPAQALDTGNTDGAIPDHVFKYISHAREVAEARTPPPPAVQRQWRKEILDTLSPLLTTHDTPRGVVVSIPSFEFEAGKLHPDTAEKVAQVAAMVVAHPGLKVVVEGYAEREDGEIAQIHAQAVYAKLIDTGVNPDIARAIGYVKPKLARYARYALDSGRVEIVVSGPAIGGMALSATR